MAAKDPKPKAARKPAQKAADPRPQSERFIAMAREIGAAEDEEGAEKALRSVVRPKRR